MIALSSHKQARQSMIALSCLRWIACGSRPLQRSRNPLGSRPQEQLCKYTRNPALDWSISARASLSCAACDASISADRWLVIHSSGPGDQQSLTRLQQFANKRRALLEDLSRHGSAVQIACRSAEDLAAALTQGWLKGLAAPAPAPVPRAATRAAPKSVHRPVPSAGPIRVAKEGGLTPTSIRPAAIVPAVAVDRLPPARSHASSRAQNRGLPKQQPTKATKPAGQKVVL